MLFAENTTVNDEKFLYVVFLRHKIGTKLRLLY